MCKSVSVSFFLLFSLSNVSLFVFASPEELEKSSDISKNSPAELFQDKSKHSNMDEYVVPTFFRRRNGNRKIIDAFEPGAWLKFHTTSDSGICKEVACLA